jgi:hypothetical protein
MTAVVMIAALALLLLLVELVARSAAGSTFADLWMKEPLLQRKDDQMRATVPRRLDVLFLGSSETMCAIDPVVIKQHAGISSYNAGVFRGVMSYVSRWGCDFALRRLEPRIVVIEVWPALLNQNGAMVDHYHQYLAAPYFTSRRRIRFLYEAGHWLVCLRMAPLLTQPARVVKLAAQTVRARDCWTARRPLALPGVIGAGGESVEHDERPTYRVGRRLRAVLEEQLDNWELGDRECAALTTLVEAARARGARVLLYEPPYTEDLWREFFPGGEEAWERAWRGVRELSESLDASWIKPELDMTSHELFADPVHANLEGKRRFSIAMGDALLPEVQASAVTAASQGGER